MSKIVGALLVLLVVAFVGYPLLRRSASQRQALLGKGKRKEIPELQDKELKAIEEEIEREVRALRKKKAPPRPDLAERAVSEGKKVFSCPDCGAKCSPDDRFCGTCGTKLKTN